MTSTTMEPGTLVTSAPVPNLAAAGSPEAEERVAAPLGAAPVPGATEAAAQRAPAAVPAAEGGIAGWLDEAGALAQQRPDDHRGAWSKVPVNPEAALDLLAPCEAREIQVLADLMEHDYLTLDQITRVLYHAERTAQTHLQYLFTHRFIGRFDRTPSWMGRAVGARNRPPGVYFLDWNGKYALEGLAAGGGRAGTRGTLRRRWRPERIAQPGSSAAHQLGLNEVWSHLIAAARLTYRSAAPGTAGLTLMVGWQDEAGAAVRYGTAAHQIVRPDAEVRLRIGPPAPRLVALEDAAVPLPDWAQACLDPRFWPATPDDLTAAMANEDPMGARYRTILVEYESGAHHPAAVIEKIKGFNTLFQQAQAKALARFGRIPRVCVVTRDDSQVDSMVALWRAHYHMRALLKPGSAACPVLVTSLPALRRAAAGPGGALGRCWVHALDPEVVAGAEAAACRMLTLGEALGVAGL